MGFESEEDFKKKNLKHLFNNNIFQIKKNKTSIDEICTFIDFHHTICSLNMYKIIQTLHLPNDDKSCF